MLTDIIKALNSLQTNENKEENKKDEINTFPDGEETSQAI